MTVVKHHLNNYHTVIQQQQQTDKRQNVTRAINLHVHIATEVVYVQ